MTTWEYIKFSLGDLMFDIRRLSCTVHDNLFYLVFEKPAMIFSSNFYFTVSEALKSPDIDISNKDSEFYTKFSKDFHILCHLVGKWIGVTKRGIDELTNDIWYAQYFVDSREVNRWKVLNNNENRKHLISAIAGDVGYCADRWNLQRLMRNVWRYHILMDSLTNQ